MSAQHSQSPHILRWALVVACLVVPVAAVLAATGFDLSTADQASSVIGLGVGAVGLAVTLASELSTRRRNLVAGTDANLFDRAAQISLDYSKSVLQGRFEADMDLRVAGSTESLALSDVKVSDLAVRIGAESQRDSPLRLALIGESGTGKSFSLAQIARIAATDRLPSEAVLVCSITDWRDDTPFMQWLAELLSTDEVLFSGEQIRNCLVGGQLTLVCDGFDDLEPDDAEALLKAVNFGPLSGASVVLAMRPDAWARFQHVAATAASFSGMQLQPLEADELIRFLRKRRTLIVREQRRVHLWQSVIDDLVAQSAINRTLVDVLRTPFFAQLAREIFSGERRAPSELLQIASEGSERLRNELLEGLVTVLYPTATEWIDRNSRSSRPALRRWLATLASFDLRKSSILNTIADRFSYGGLIPLVGLVIAAATIQVSGSMPFAVGVGAACIAMYIAILGHVANGSDDYSSISIPPRRRLRDERFRVLRSTPFLAVSGGLIGLALAESVDAHVTTGVLYSIVLGALMPAISTMQDSYRQNLQRISYGLLSAATALQAVISFAWWTGYATVAIAGAGQVAYLRYSHFNTPAGKSIARTVLVFAVDAVALCAAGIGIYLLSLQFPQSVWWLAAVAVVSALLYAGALSLGGIDNGDFGGEAFGAFIAVAALVGAASMVSDKYLFIALLLIATVLVALSSSIWLRFLQGQLVGALKGSIPADLLSFCQELVNYGVLQPSGGSYRFRIRRYQDLLAPDRAVGSEERFEDRADLSELLDRRRPARAEIDRLVAGWRPSMPPSVRQPQPEFVLQLRQSIGQPGANSSISSVRDYVEETSDTTAMIVLGMALIDEGIRFREEGRSYRTWREARADERDFMLESDRALDKMREGEVWLRRGLLARDSDSPLVEDGTLFLAEYLFGEGGEGEALELLQPLADRGLLNASVAIARMYWSCGDADAARAICERPAEEGHLGSILAMADFSFREERWVTAARWYEAAIRQGSLTAFARLGTCRSRAGDRQGALSAWETTAPTRSPTVAVVSPSVTAGVSA